MLVEIFTNIQVGSDLITDDWLNTMFPFTVYKRNLLLIKFSIFNLFLNGFHSKEAVIFRDLILGYELLKTEGKLTGLLARYICKNIEPCL